MTGKDKARQLWGGPDAAAREASWQRWLQVLSYSHTLDDMRRIASGTGNIKLYHGAPEFFANQLVEKGATVPYKVEDVGRNVAALYGIAWMKFQPYVYRQREVITKLSTATAPVAMRWAISFPIGEVLSDLNEKARLVKAAIPRAAAKGISVDDAYEELFEEALELAHSKGISVSQFTYADELGLPNLLPLSETGVLVEFDVDIRAIPDYTRTEAGHLLQSLDQDGEPEILYAWNQIYRDIKVAPQHLKQARIVIRGFQPYDIDVVEARPEDTKKLLGLEEE